MVEITVRPGPTSQPWQNVSGAPQTWPDPVVQSAQKWPDLPAASAQKWPDAPAQTSQQRWPDAPVPKEGQSIQPVDIPKGLTEGRQKVEAAAGEATGVTEAAKVLRGEETPEEQQSFAVNSALGLLPELGALGGIALKSAGVIGASRLSETALGKRILRPLEKILSPGTVSPEAEGAAGAIRGATGTAARDTAITAYEMEPYHKVINQLPEPDRFSFINHVEGRSGGSQLPPHLTKLDPLADVLKDQFEQRMTKLQALPSTQKMSFIEDYYPHMWQDPNAAKAFAQNFGTEIEPKISLNRTGGARGTHKFSLLNEKGEPAGEATVHEENDGKNLYVDWIGGKLSPEGAMEGINAFGPKQVRGLLGQLKEAFPGAETVSGFRGTGARTTTGGGATKVSLPKAGAGKQGSGASLKKRTMPTIADGIAAGLKPVTTDPIEATMRYVRSMDNFIASTEVLDTAKANGTVKYFRPRVMGASGNTQGAPKIPDGWVPLSGRGATSATGEQAYAPEDWARVYNNYIDRGIHKNADWGKVYDALQHGSNAITSMELGLSGYHAVTMAKEAVISDFANGLQNIIGGNIPKGIATIAKAPVAWARLAKQGKKVEQTYLSRTAGTPDMRKVLDIAEKAGMRGVGRGHAPDYSMSAMGNYWTSWKRGALQQEMQAGWQNIKSGPVGAFKEVTKNIGRTMQTVAAPIFEKYIPRLKNGAVYETLRDWMDLHPNATTDEQVKAAREIVDAMDDRFGEMIQDNIFWNKTMKQVSQLALRSYSWDLGTLRLAGGVRDLARGKMTRKAEYAIAMPIVAGTVAAAYQYLKTGKPPEQLSDVIAPKTGGTTAGVSVSRDQQYMGRKGAPVPQRARLPGYEFDALGWIHDPWQEALNKVATGPRMVVQALSGKDYGGFPIAPEADTIPWLTDYFKWASQSLVPISIKQATGIKYPGSNLGGIEGMMGIREAPAYLEDPTGYARSTTAIQRRAKQSKENYEKKQEQLRNPKPAYGGANE